MSESLTDKRPVLFLCPAVELLNRGGGLAAIMEPERGKKAGEMVPQLVAEDLLAGPADVALPQKLKAGPSFGIAPV